jgi:RNA polymerase sigma-70 factor, ECF subfamily
LGQKEASWSVVIAEEHFSTSNPIKELLLKELSAEVKAVLSKLPFKYREVLLLHDYEGLKLPEVAQILGESIDAVKSRLYRARDSFISLISPYISTKSSSVEVERV